jgi:hypothetical protein
MTQIAVKTVALAGAIAGMALFAQPGAAIAADAAGNWAAINKCAAIADNSARLICMDAVLSTAGAAQGNSPAAPEARSVPVQEPARAAEAPAAPAPAPAPAATRQSTDLSPEQREAFFPADTSPEEESQAVNEIEVTLADVRKAAGQKYRLTDTEGVTWQQLYTTSSRVPPKAGQSMTVHKNSLGGYLCRVESTPTFRCKPLS